MCGFALILAALDALLGNVFRHTPQGTAFAVDVHNAEDAVIVLVSDAGPGMPDPGAAMARGRGSGSDGSTGLGLNIVRRLAESTGGDVRIGSSVLGGTEMRIRLQMDGRAAPVRRGHRGPCAGVGREVPAVPLTGPDPFLKRASRPSTAVRIVPFARSGVASVLPHPTFGTQGEEARDEHPPAQDQRQEQGDRRGRGGGRRGRRRATPRRGRRSASRR